MQLIELAFVIIGTIAFAILSWLGLKEYDTYRLKKKLGIRGNVWGTLENILSKWNKGRWDFKGLELRIKQAGSPFGMTIVKYWVAKLLLPIMALGYAFGGEHEIITAVVLMAIAFFFPDIWLISKRRDRIFAFRQELPEAIDTIELGVTADVPLNDTFLLAADTVEGGELKRELLYFSANYFVTRDREKCLKTFTDNLGIPEAKILAMALMQGEKTGRTRDIVSSISSGMFNTTIAKVNRDEKTVEYKVLFTLFLLMASSVMIYLQPYFLNLEYGLRSIF